MADGIQAELDQQSDTARRHRSSFLTRWIGHRRFQAALLFVVLCGIYHLNGDFLEGGDATPNVYLPVSVLNEGNLSFTPSEMPFMFTWKLETPDGVYGVRLAKLDQKVMGRTARELYENGALVVGRGKYYVLPSVRTDPVTKERLFVSTFGPGVGLTALPVVTVLHLISGDLLDNPQLLWYASKSVASCLVAGSAVFVFLTILRYTSRRNAWIVALTYGLGTCVWSTSSQALWQHGPNEFFLAMGTFFLTGIGERRRYSAFCGLAYGMAVVCRPTSAIVVVIVGVYLLTVNRRSLLTYIIAGLPLAIALGAYNMYYLGSPVSFGQTDRAGWVAEYKTGSTEIWQTPLCEGASGLLFSPSRGLLVYSPVVAFGIIGMFCVWRDPYWSTLRPVAFAVPALWGISFKWFDWWGGWCFGYRPLVDTMPLLILFMIPVIDHVCRRRWLFGMFAMMAAWSIVVQVVGAFAYNLTSWNARLSGYELRLPNEPNLVVVPDMHAAEHLARTSGARILGPRMLDIDQVEHRHRLWSVSDSQILYYLTHFDEARRQKRKSIKQWIADPTR